MKIVSLLFISTLIVSCNSNQKEESEHQGRPSVHELINEFDSNKDGKLSESEVGGPLASDFQKIDTDKDGFLSEKELELAPKPPRKGGEQMVVNKEDIDAAVKGVSVNTSYFIKENIIGEITEKKVDLSGIETLCYVIKTHSQAIEHQMGPWCPRHIEDGMEKAGIWFENDKVYDVSGHFDDERGYHYHAGEPGGNQIIACLHGLPGYTEVKE